MSEEHSGPTFEQLAEEFAERFRQGERPKPQEYADRYPKFADQIHDLFPAMVMMEEIAPDSDDSIDTLAEAKCRSKQQHPTQIGDFRIVRQAGRGGMGVVYEAEQVSLGRHVALKVLPQLADTKQKRRFEREAKAAAKLHHTNIVPVFGVGEENGISYYVMQFIQGLGLDEVLDELRQLQNADGSATATPRELKVSRVTPGSDMNRSYKTAAHELSAAEVARSLLTGQFENELSDQDDQREDEQDVGQAAMQQVTATATPESMTPTSRGDSSVSNSSGSFSLSSSTLSSPGSGEIIPSKRRPQTYWHSVAHIGRQVGEALQYAHDQGVLHRDVKPGNLLLDMRGTVWVTDFGLAKANDQQDITHTGDIFGTLRYMPPEAFETKTEAQGDIYSLGLTLYELLALQPAFRDRDRQQLVKHITTGELTPLNKLNPAVPRDLVTIIHRAVERNSRDRYQSAGQLAEDLQRFLDDEPIKARRITLTERFIRWTRRNKALASSLATLAGLLVVVAVGSVLMAGYYQELASRNASLAAEKSEALRKEKQALEVSLSAQHDARLSLYQASMLATQQALANSQSSIRAKGLLSQLRPKQGETDLRGWEWFYLNSLVRRDESLVIPLRAIKYSAAFDPTGGRIAAGGSNEIAVYDAITGRELFSRSYADAFWEVAWSPDGKWLAAGGHPDILRVWNTEDWTEVHSMTGQGHVFAIAWSPDSQRLASGGSDATIRVWGVDQNAGDAVANAGDATAGWKSDKPLFTLSGHTKMVGSISWNQDGTRIASASHDETVRIWDAETEELIRVLDAHKLASNALAWNSDDTQIAVCGSNRICILDAETGQTLRSFRLPWNPFWLGWSPNGKYLAVAEHMGNSARVLHASTGETILNIKSPTSGFTNNGLNKEATRLVTSGERELRIWNTSINPAGADKVGHRIGIAEPSVERFAYQPGGNHIAVTDGDQSEARIWDVSSQTKRLTLRGEKGTITDLAWKPDASVLTTGGEDGAIVLWDPTKGKVLETLPGHADSHVNSLAWQSRGTRFASAGGDLTVRVWDESGRQLRAFKTQSEPRSVSWHPTEPWLAAAVLDTIYIWDTNSGKQLASYANPGLVLRTISFNQQGNLIAAAGGRADDQTVLLDSLHEYANIRLWDIEKSVQRHELRGHGDPVNSIRWNRAGDRIVTASDDSTVKIWNAQTGQELLSFRSDDDSPVTFADFDPSEVQIVAVTSSKRILNWDATPGYEVELSERLLPVLANRIQANPKAKDLVTHAKIQARAGDWQQAARDFEQAAALSDNEVSWFPTYWRGIGPFAAQPVSELPAEVAPLVPNAPLDREELVTWNALELDRDEYLDLSRYLDSSGDSTAFAVLRVYSTSSQSVGCIFGGTGWMQLFCNGKVVHRHERPRPVRRDDQAVTLEFQSGWNTIAVQVSQDDGHHGLFAKLTNDDKDLAQVFERTGQWRRALHHWSRIVKEDPSESSQLALGRVALRASERRVAEDAFADAIGESAASVSGTRQRIGEIYAQHGLEILQTPAREGDSQASREKSALASLVKARRIFEEMISKTEDTNLATMLSNVLYYPIHSDSWTFLKTIEATSAGGARLRRLWDHSILADGINPPQDQYTIVSETSVDNIVAIRLEPIGDRSMVEGNTGRCVAAGDFMLAEFRLFVVSPDGRSREIAFRKALRDGKPQDAFRQASPDARHEGEKAIDGDPETFFSDDFGQTVFVPEEPIHNPGLLQLKTVMTFGRGQHSLGRFRLSVTNDAQLIEPYENRVKMAVQENRWVRLAMSYALIGETHSAAMSFARALDDGGDEESITEIVTQAQEYPSVLEELRKLRPSHDALRALP